MRDARLEMDESTFLRLRDLIYQASGLYFDQRNQATLEHRLRPRINARMIRLGPGHEHTA